MPPLNEMAIMIIGPARPINPIDRICATVCQLIMRARRRYKNILIPLYKNILS